ncbi:MAG: hypothetical protein LBP98_03380 [Tannerella sp.]|jgi:hypothetical protein|nr:hypothetical protein [Tannerella sp.]
MKKKIFTLCMISFLLSGVFSNVRAKEVITGKINNLDPITVSSSRTVDYTFVDCPFNLTVDTAAGTWSAISSGTKRYVIMNDPALRRP